MSSSDPLASFPPAIREAHARWLDTRDLTALDTVVLAIVAYHRPKRATGDDISAPQLPESARLIEDLGYDSLSLAEVVFFVEDLYQVGISNADLKTIATIGDLRTYVRRRITR